MDAVLRALTIYVFLLVVFRIAGRRTMTKMTNFDLVLLLIISEATQNAMIGNDYSVTNAFIIILTLVGIDILLSLLKRWSLRAEQWLEGLPMVLVDNGQPLPSLMHKARIDTNDILTAARESQGLERMDQIKYAVLEASGGISIIPKTQA